MAGLGSKGLSVVYIILVQFNAKQKNDLKRLAYYKFYDYDTQVKLLPLSLFVNCLSHHLYWFSATSRSTIDFIYTNSEYVSESD